MSVLPTLRQLLRAIEEEVRAAPLDAAILLMHYHRTLREPSFRPSDPFAREHVAAMRAMLLGKLLAYVQARTVIEAERALPFEIDEAERGIVGKVLAARALRESTSRTLQ